jgi:hypothetical protein
MKRIEKLKEFKTFLEEEAIVANVTGPTRGDLRSLRKAQIREESKDTELTKAIGQYVKDSGAGWFTSAKKKRALENMLRDVIRKNIHTGKGSPFVSKNTDGPSELEIRMNYILKDQKSMSYKFKWWCKRTRYNLKQWLLTQAKKL